MDFNFIGMQLSIKQISSVLEDTVLDLFSLMEEPLRHSLCKRKSFHWKLVFVAVNCNGVGDNLKRHFNFHAVKTCDNGVIN